MDNTTNIHDRNNVILAILEEAEGMVSETIDNFGTNEPATCQGASIEPTPIRSTEPLQVHSFPFLVSKRGAPQARAADAAGLSTPTVACPQESPEKKSSPMPRRPLSAYNLFFKAERERIVKEINDNRGPNEGLPTRRGRPRTLGIGFGGLARQIAQRWKAIGKAERGTFEAMADKEKERYEREVTIWREENPELAAQKRKKKTKTKKNGKVAKTKQQQQQQQHDRQHTAIVSNTDRCNTTTTTANNNNSMNIPHRGDISNMMITTAAGQGAKSWNGSSIRNQIWMTPLASMMTSSMAMAPPPVAAATANKNNADNDNKEPLPSAVPLTFDDLPTLRPLEELMGRSFEPVPLGTDNVATHVPSSTNDCTANRNEMARNCLASALMMQEPIMSMPILDNQFGTCHEDHNDLDEHTGIDTDSDETGIDTILTDEENDDCSDEHKQLGNLSRDDLENFMNQAELEDFW